MKLYAVTGNPIAHSRSPDLFHAAFFALGVNAIYTRLAADSPGQSLKLAREIGLRGMNVTSPFKEDIASLVDTLDPVAKKLGAVNCVVFHPNHTEGFNTDPRGVIGALKRQGGNPKGKKALIIGAGGAARAAALACLSAGADVTIANRTVSRAREAARILGCRYSTLDHLPKQVSGTDILISCLPGDQARVDSAWLRSRHVVLDANYRDSRLSSSAKQRGCRVASGLDWLIFQAIPALEIFTGRNVTYQTMRQAIADSNDGKLNKGNLALIGTRGAGVTAIGESLARKLGMEFVTLDSFMEFQFIPAMRKADKKIFALTGRNIGSPRDRQTIKERCSVIGLWAGPEPSASKVFGFTRASDLVISSGGSTAKIVRKILDEIR